jgi:hypothetical protein
MHLNRREEVLHAIVQVNCFVEFLFARIASDLNSRELVYLLPSLAILYMNIEPAIEKVEDDAKDLLPSSRR